MTSPIVDSFFHEPTSTAAHVVADPDTGTCAVVDSVLDYAPNSGRTRHDFADRIVDHVREKGYAVQWILETHVHADHLSAAPTVHARLGGTVGIGSNITRVQAVFGDLFNAEASFRRDGSQFGKLFHDGESFTLGSIEATALHTPGHTPACMTYVIGDAAFVGDTIFMPDFGTARCDFPGGDARRLYRSIHRIFALPDETRLFLCHDYKAPGRDSFAWETTVGEEKRRNVHVREGIDEDAFVTMRTARDATLDMPTLILPSVQVNMRAGDMPPPEDNGKRYLKIPIDAL